MQQSEDLPSVLLAAFDAFPGLKGAQAHMRTNLAALTSAGRDVSLLCLGRESYWDPETGTLVCAFDTEEKNLLRRSELFAHFLTETADTMMARPPAVIHFRDIWSGVPLLSHPFSRDSRIIFEVNGLPSVELPDHYPHIAANGTLIDRLRRMEEDCLALADRVITVSRRTAHYLMERGCPGEKISIIPNAAAILTLSRRETAAMRFSFLAPPEKKIILYTGTLAPWQGLDTLFEAAMLLRHRKDCHFVIAASGKKRVNRFRKQIQNSGLNDCLTILEGIPHGEMPSLYARAYLSVAPLSRGARNELQGCSPLKIVESMACATPVVASDLPVVRELVESQVSGWLVSPDSPRALATAIAAMLEDRALRDRLALQAYERAVHDFGTDLFAERLNALYENLTGG